MAGHINIGGHTFLQWYVCIFTGKIIIIIIISQGDRDMTIVDNINSSGHIFLQWYVCIFTGIVIIIIISQVDRIGQ